MRLTIDVEKDPLWVKLGDLEIQLENIPQDLSWKVQQLSDQLNETLSLLEKARQDLQAKPEIGYISSLMAEQTLRHILDGWYTPNNKINCIKLIRELTGMFLVDAKKLVDRLIPNGSNWPSQEETAQ